MKRKNILLLIAYFIISTNILAKEFILPDYEQIQALGQTQYETLLRRFQQQDTTLSLTDFQTVYYGSAFYGYLGSGVDRKELDAAYEKGQNAFTSYLDKCLDKTPVDLNTIYYRWLVADNSNDTNNATKYAWMFNQLFDAIGATGDAASPQTGLHVVSVADEYAIIYQALGMSLEQQTLLTSECDLMEVVKKDGTKIKLYFDVQLVLALESQRFSDSNKPLHFTYHKHTK